MIGLTVGLTFIAVATIVYYIANSMVYRDRQIKTRLERLKPVLPAYTQLDQELERPFGVRVIMPLLNRLSGLAVRTTPVNIRNRAELLLEQGGHPWSLNVTEFLVIKMLVTLALPCFVFLLMLRSPSKQMGPLVVIAALLLGMILPEFILKRQITIRKTKISDALPDCLDLLTVSVEAGLGFDQALLKLVEKSKGPLPQEFKRLLQEIRIGKTRRDAFRELANRTGVDDVLVFTTAIIQADQLGVSIGNVLRIQSQQLRQKRRLKAEERAQKAPVKMLIPMILFIFPSLFIILLGPGILQFIDSFMKVKK